MLKQLTVASLLVGLAAGAALAQPHPLRPTPILEIDTVAAGTHALITSEHVWVNGGWTFEDFRQKTPKTTSGRLTDDQLRELRTELSRAPWQHQLTQPPCKAPENQREYRVDSRLVYTDPTCGDQLDDVSLQVLAYVRGFVDGAIVAQ